MQFKEDKYDGVTISPESLPNTEKEFQDELDKNIELWSNQNKRGIWLQIPIERSELIPIATKKFNFQFHHAEKQYIMLTRWLPKTQNNLPSNASHQVGIGALIVNKKKQVLVIQEKSGILRGMKIWKLPTGISEQGEELNIAAERETYEETGIKCKFVSVLSFRQAHNFRFGKSDLFFQCALEPTEEDQTLNMQENEIANIKWMDYDEFMSYEFFWSQPSLNELMRPCKEYINGKFTGFQPYRVGFNFPGITRKDNVYHSLGPETVQINSESLWNQNQQNKL